MKFLLQKTIAVLMIVAILAPSGVMFLPVKAQAQGGASFSQMSASPIIGAGISCGISKLAGLLKGKADTTTVGTNDNATKELENKETCLKKIARAGAQVALKKITVATVNWINSGFKGEPAYVKNPGSFFTSIANEEIASFSANLSVISPFGRDFTRNLILSTQLYFEQNAQYSLGQVIGPTNIQEFNANFAVGGWDGWLAMTQFPENNPVGFTYIASTEISGRLAGTKLSKAQEVMSELSQSGGFLSFKKCVEPADYQVPDSSWDRNADIAIANSGSSFIGPQQSNSGQIGPQQGGIIYSQGEIDAARERLRKYTCIRNETTTPGGVISNQLTKTLDIPTDSLINSEDLDSSLTAIFDALLNQLAQKGLNSLSGEESSGSGDELASGSFGTNTVSTGGSFGGGGVADPWQNASGAPFNIDTDIPGLITIQKEYETALTQLKNAVNETIPEIKQADFCLPGPNPEWMTTAGTMINDYFEGTEVISLEEVNESLLHNTIAEFYNEDIERKYKHRLESITGLSAKANYRVDTREEIFVIINRIFQGGYMRWEGSQDNFVGGYKQHIEERYSLIKLPLVATEILSLFKSGVQYEIVASEMDEQIAQRRSVIRKLEYIQENLDRIELLPPGPTVDSEKDLYIKSFNRLAPSIVTEKDVDNIKADITQAEDDIRYATDLVYACRLEVDGINKDGIFVGTTYTGPKERMPYVGIPNKYNFPTGNSFLPAIRYGDYGAGVNYAPGEPFGGMIYVNDLLDFDGGGTYNLFLQKFEEKIKIY